MYNVKVFKYPSGWQVRTYSRPVGATAEGLDNPADWVSGSVWNPEVEEWEHVRYNSNRQEIEPFTYQLATRIRDENTQNLERSALSSLSRTKNRVIFLSRSNVWEWFITLTFNPEKVDSLDYDACVHRLKNWLIICRRICPGLKYIIVPEQHKSGRYHFHGLFANCDGLDFRDSGIVDNGKTIYNIGKYRLGWSTATKVQDNARVTQYISKYITKDLCAVTLGKKRYWASRNLDEAETEEYLVDIDQMEAYMGSLESMSIYDKEIETSEMIVHYYEMGLGEDEE